MMKVQRRVLLLLITILLSLIAGIFSIENCIASGDIIYVNDSNISGPWNGTQEHPYQYIQDGIDAANSSDTVHVYSGTYNENVEITKDLTLTGQNKDTTLIDGGKNSYVVHAYGTLGNEIEIHISGFTVRNAGGTGNDCIALSYANNGNINNNKILNSDKSDGIQLDHCSGITINDNQISGNTAAGIRLTLSENSIIYNNVIQNNQKGIYFCHSSSDNEIYDNTITGNSQYGVHIQVSTVQSQNNYFYRNDFKTNGQNAKDPYSNYWSHNSQGNYWDDYDDYDSDEDGIGDSPYNISGGSNQDVYPLGYFLEPDPNGGNQQPTAYQPTIYPNPATYGNTVSFSGSGSDNDGYIAGYNWRSSIDGQLSTNNEFSTSSLSVGAHTIYFKVQDNEGIWSSEQTASFTINPTENQDPTAFVDSVTPNPAEYMMMISFCGHGTDEDGYITAWKWTSSIDGIIGNEEAFNISDLSIGTHTIYFQVRDNASEWSEQVTESLIISLDSLNQPPIANAGGPLSGNMNDEIIFDGSASYDEDGEIIEYLWDFGDGTNEFGESVTHTYTSPGNYTITLIVTDDDKDNSTDTNIATVVQSSGQNSGNAGAAGFELELPIPLVFIIEAAFVVVGISTFLFWIKRK